MADDMIPDGVLEPHVYVGETLGVKLRWSAISDPGKVRVTNEDGAMTSTGIYLLADGMGGHEGGEVASAAALSSMGTLEPTDHRQVLKQFSSSIELAANNIDHIESKTGRQAGTTLTGAVLTHVRGKAHWLVVNIGDSRTYLYRDEELQQLTVDHSQVQELIDSGFLTVEQAKVDVRRNVITRALGAGMEPEIEYWLYPLQPGDKLLLCSDGLTGELDDPFIADILQGHTDPAGAVKELVTESLKAGARDNVTLIVVEVSEIDDEVLFVPPDPEDDAVIHGELYYSRKDDGTLSLDEDSL